ncbi:DNA ligase/mRNA capping enzyme [Auriculariales sp. MPI-PUGE-AT-0066]|nr:DNA ligase/mRNA capping enzyme [Auriculariales sp. MPI-PUGE-AT-0066]
MPKDELAEIDGHKPKAVLPDGESTQVKSMSSDTLYRIKRVTDHYYCDCPAWCHLKEFLGEAYEDERLAKKSAPKGKKAAASKAKTTKRKKRDEDEADDDDDNDKPRKRAKPAAKSTKGRKKADYDDDEEDEEDDKPIKKAKPAAKAPAAKGRKKVEYDDDEEEEEEEAAAAISSKKTVPALLLANKYDLEKGPDPTGWLVSEKLDGQIFLSRLGNQFFAPDWFLEALPKDVELDGELFGGRGKFNNTVSVVKTKNSPHWKTVQYHVFDVPSHGKKPFEERFKLLEGLFGKNGSHASDHVVIVPHTELESREQMDKMLEEVQKKGGEGLMLRKPKSEYVGTRSSTLLKVKTFYDAEAKVTGYSKGRGKNVGVTGALVCEMESGKTFQVGSGMTDAQRKNPPKIGSIVVYRFMELTASGVPRHPTFVGQSADKTEPKDAEVRKVDNADDEEEEA